MAHSELPDDRSADPARDATLGHWLRAVDEARHVDASDLLRRRVTTSAADALRRRRSRSWWVSTAQSGRFAIPLGLVAAAVAAITITRVPTRAPAHDPHLLAAIGVASPEEAAYWSVAGRDRALFSVFGEVAP